MIRDAPGTACWTQKTNERMWKYALKPANLFTASSLFCGFYSIVLSAGASNTDGGAFHAAAVLILFAGLFDMLDGPVARITRTMSEFGKNLDSFADLVAFGIAPGVLLYKWGLAEFEILGFAVAFLFVLAGTLRLSRFNLGVDDGDPAFSRGLTITVSGVTVAVLVIFHHRTGMELLESQLNILLFTLFLSYLMVSRIRFRTIKSVRFRPRVLALVGLAAFSLLIVAVLLDLSVLLVLIATTYIGGNLLEQAVTRRRRRWASYLDEWQAAEEDDEFDEFEDSLDDELPLGAAAGPPPGRRRFRIRWPFRRR